MRIGELKKQREKEVIRNKESYSQAGSSLKSPRVKESKSPSQWDHPRILWIPRIPTCY